MTNFANHDTAKPKDTILGSQRVVIKHGGFLVLWFTFLDSKPLLFHQCFIKMIKKLS